MALYQDMAEEFVRLDKTTSSGPFGTTTQYVEGAVFMANAKKQSNTELRIAEKSMQIGNYLVTIIDDTVLEQNDVIKRISDGLILKIDSIEDKTPEVASFKFKQAYAYEFRLGA